VNGGTDALDALGTFRCGKGCANLIPDEQHGGKHEQKNDRANTEYQFCA
jgi:hypothetical protein